MDVLKRLADSVVVPVVVLEKAEDAIPTANAMLAGGIDTMEITFAGTQAETDTERDFFRFLVREGIPVRVESNR